MLKGSPVRIENVSKNFGTFQVLKNIHLEIQKGEFFSLLGPSGCGKTTLLRLIAGFETPSTGMIYMNNIDITQKPSNKRHINTVFQNYALFPHLTVFENVAFGLKIKKFPNDQIQSLVHEYLSLVKLTDHAHKYPFQLSGGQKQRVAIARALVNKPDVLLLDEPLSALDAKLRQQLLVELDLIHDQIGITFIYVTHDQQEALGVSDRIAIMHEGHILQVGTSKEIYEKPVNQFVATFIGETNLFSGVVSASDKQHIAVFVDGIGECVAPSNPAIQKGASVNISLRPERIEVSKNPPTAPVQGPVLEGIVDEIIYFGFQSKLFVKIGDNLVIRVFKQHEMYNEAYLTYQDKVYLWWDKEDCYLIENSAK